MLIQDVGTHNFDVEYLTVQPQDDDYLILVNQADIYLNPETNDLYQVKDYDLGKEQLVFVFSIDDRKVFLPLMKSEALLSKAKAIPLKELDESKHHLKLAGATGMHLSTWYRNHRFCGRCGGENHLEGNERALKCEKCGHLTFPVICPAIILAIIDKKKDRILLTKSALRRNGRYALISGYTEIGETLEQTATREAFEEVGLRVKNLKYYINQPWGFSGSLMVGFFAELDGDDQVTLQEEEIAEATWFTRETMPVTDGPIDITHHMMEMWRLGKV